MVRSMTGFGRCETEIDGREITVEIKSVNHRYFEFSCRSPRGYSFVDDKLKSFINERVSRGKIDVFVSIGAADDTPAEVSVNHSLVSGYLKAMSEISETYGIENDATVVSISRFPEVFTVHKAPEDEEKITADVLTEVAVFSDKVAVAEETVRLRSHFEQLNAFLELDQPVGRKIDFIIQEMNREANTIGSKVQDAELAHKVVDIKGEIEKIREQVQNIE